MVLSFSRSYHSVSDQVFRTIYYVLNIKEDNQNERKCVINVLFVVHFLIVFFVCDFINAFIFLFII